MGKEEALAQRGTSFNTLDNWGHETPTHSKRKRNRKEKFKGSWPETHTIHADTLWRLQKPRDEAYIYLYIISE